MKRPLYRSFLVRLWCEPADGGTWHGEIEHIQTGTVIEVGSLEDALDVIQSAAVKDDEPSVDRDPQMPGTASGSSL